MSKSVKHGALNPAPASGSPRAFISGREGDVPVHVPPLEGSWAQAPTCGQHIPVHGAEPCTAQCRGAKGSCAAPDWVVFPQSCQLGVCWQWEHSSCLEGMAGREGFGLTWSWERMCSASAETVCIFKFPHVLTNVFQRFHLRKMLKFWG